MKHFLKGLFDELFDVSPLDLSKKCRRFLYRFGKGSAVSVDIFDHCDQIRITFERKIGPHDVKEGKLVPISYEEVRRRGGKRIFAFSLSPDGAQALHDALGKALAEKQKREAPERFLTVIAHLICSDKDRLSH